jgi:hypothetical protein
MRKTAADPLVREADDITYLILREGSKVPEVCDKKVEIRVFDTWHAGIAFLPAWRVLNILLSIGCLECSRSWRAIRITTSLDVICVDLNHFFVGANRGDYNSKSATRERKESNVKWWTQQSPRRRELHKVFAPSTTRVPRLFGPRSGIFHRLLQTTP